MCASSLQTVSITPSIGTLVVLCANGISPHGKISDNDVGTWVRGWAVHIKRCSLNTNRVVTLPVIEGDAVVQDAVTCDRADRGPVRIEVEAVSIVVSNEVVERDLGDTAVSAVGLQHDHLVAVDGIDVIVLNL